jgi:hypothetical protein
LASLFDLDCLQQFHLHVKTYGDPALILKGISFLLAGIWLVLNYTANQAFDYGYVGHEFHHAPDLDLASADRVGSPEAKAEDIYRQDYGDGLAAGRGLGKWFVHYNTQRPHQSLENATLAEWYFSPQDHGGCPATWEAMKSSSPVGPNRTAGPILAANVTIDSTDF